MQQRLAIMWKTQFLNRLVTESNWKGVVSPLKPLNLSLVFCNIFSTSVFPVTPEPAAKVWEFQWFLNAVTHFSDIRMITVIQGIGSQQPKVGWEKRKWVWRRFFIWQFEGFLTVFCCFLCCLQRLSRPTWHYCNDCNDITEKAQSWSNHWMFLIMPVVQEFW